MRLQPRKVWLGTWLAVLGAFGGLVAPVSAADITFTSALNRLNLDSSGAPLTSSFVFELGAFAPGFTPTPANADQWVANWISLRRAPYVVATNIYSATVITTNNTAPFGVGSPAWVWGYRASGGTPDWILMRSPQWLWPVVTEINPRTFTTSQANATATIGSLAPANRPPNVHMQFAAAPAGARSPTLTAEEWRTLTFFGELADPKTQLTGDYNGDGLQNLLEFALNGDPRRAFTALLPQAIIEEIDGKRYVALRVRRNPAANVTWVVERSPTLAAGSWVTDGLVTSVNTPEELIVRYIVPIAEMATEEMFLRLRVLAVL